MRRHTAEAKAGLGEWAEVWSGEEEPAVVLSAVCVELVLPVICLLPALNSSPA